MVGSRLPVTANAEVTRQGDEWMAVDRDHMVTDQPTA
jgi:hypothetical protein